MNAGRDMMLLAEELFPICRSITGDGLRRTLKIVAGHIPLTLHEIPSGTKAYDWTVPPEWNIRGGSIETNGDASTVRVLIVTESRNSARRLSVPLP